MLPVYLYFLGDYYVEYHYDCEASTFESLTYTTAFRASKYFRNFPKDTYIDAVSRSGDDYVNVFLKNNWYIIDPFGEITEKLKTTSFFGCEVSKNFFFFFLFFFISILRNIVHTAEPFFI